MNDSAKLVDLARKLLAEERNTPLMVAAKLRFYTKGRLSAAESDAIVAAAQQEPASQVVQGTAEEPADKPQTASVAAQREAVRDSLLYDPRGIYPSREWVVEGLAALRSMVGWIGPEKSQKSLIALRLAMHIACGRDFFGFKVPKARRVVYFDAENPTEEVDLRYKALLAHFTEEEQATIDQNLKVIRGRDLINNGVNIEITNEGFWNSFADRYSAEVYLLDALQMFHSKQDISNREIKQVLLTLRNYCGPEHCLIIIHHTRKREEHGIPHPALLRKVGARPWSDKCLGAGVFKRLPDVTICQELFEVRDKEGELCDWTVDFAAFGRITEDVPLLHFKGEDEYWHVLVRDLSPPVKASYEKLCSAAATMRAPWPSRNAAATALRPLSRSQANVHVGQLIRKQYLRVLLDGSVEIA